MGTAIRFIISTCGTLIAIACAVFAIILILIVISASKNEPINWWIFILYIPLLILGYIGYWIRTKGYQFLHSKWEKAQLKPDPRVVASLEKINTTIQAYTDNLNARTAHKKERLGLIMSRASGPQLLNVFVQGGEGWKALSGQKMLFSYDLDFIYLSDKNGDDERVLPIEEIEAVTIGGPGTVTNGGGALGGGSNVEGFIIGAAAATVLNLLTTHKSTRTLVRIETAESELFLLISTLNPEEMRQFLSPIFRKIDAKIKTRLDKTLTLGIADELLKLEQLKASGSLTDEEFLMVKNRIITR